MTPSAAVFSPTDTKDWDRCPIYRSLKRDGWVPRGAGWEPNILLGMAIGDGLSEAYRHWADPNPGAFGEPVALTVLEVEYAGSLNETIKGLGQLVKRGLAAAIQADAPRGRQIVRVDQSIGVCRPDLIVRGPSGLATINTKVSRAVRPDYRASRLAEYGTDFQLWHEAWEAEQFFGEPVVSRGILQITLSPRLEAVLEEWPVTPEGMMFWLRGAEDLWQRMAAERDYARPPVPRHSSCHGKFGRCVYHDFCHEFGGDPSRASVYYTQGAP